MQTSPERKSSTMTHKILLSLGLGLLSTYLPTYVAADEADAFLQFKQALAEPAWIGAAADHPKAIEAYRPIPPLETFPTEAGKRTLGFVLFHDPRLSADGTVACNSCHTGMRGGSDGKPFSEGIGGALGDRNSPTVFNSAFNFRQFWDGRSETLADQALGPIENPVEMGHDLDAVVEFIKQDSNYSSQFEAIYPDGVTAANLGDAISQHVKDMTRTDSRFNAYLQGDSTALNAQEQRGLERFNAVGCSSCHNGINLGGNSYQKIGLASDYLPVDQGIYKRSGRPEDRGVLKVPTLHNIAMTAPYFHDGSTSDLSQAVSRMATETTGRQLNDSDVADIVAFLGSLSSEFFASMAPRMGQEAMQGEMRDQIAQMDHGAGGMNHGGDMDHGAGGMNHGGDMDHGAGGMNHGGDMDHGAGGMNHGGDMDHGAGGMNHGRGRDHGSAMNKADMAPQAAEEMDHPAAYQKALDFVRQSEGLLLSEMERIHSGEVAHYDFLQFQHLELLRHARALQHPPASLASAKRERLIEQAGSLLRAAESLEWIIADFLRAESALRSARSNQADLQGQKGTDALLAIQQGLLDSYRDVPTAKIAELNDAGIAERAAEFNL